MNTTLKTCFKCGTQKPRCDFYRHPRMGDGLLGKCKECTKRDVSDRYWRKHQEILEYDRTRASLPHRVEYRKRYAKTDRGRRASRKGREDWERRFPEKVAAARAVQNALRRGDLVRGCCMICGKPRAEAHHDDYSKPLAVRWLCVRHHKEHHKSMRRALEAAA